MGDTKGPLMTPERAYQIWRDAYETADGNSFAHAVASAQHARTLEWCREQVRALFGNTALGEIARSMVLAALDAPLSPDRSEDAADRKAAGSVPSGAGRITPPSDPDSGAWFDHDIRAAIAGGERQARIAFPRPGEPQPAAAPAFDVEREANIYDRDWTHVLSRAGGREALVALLRRAHEAGRAAEQERCAGVARYVHDRCRDARDVDGSSTAHIIEESVRRGSAAPVEPDVRHGIFVGPGAAAYGPATVPRGHCNRCDRCGWEFATDRDHGCVPGDCSMRPAGLRRTACAGCGAPYCEEGGR
jgi:hypothetical protein